MGYALRQDDGVILAHKSRLEQEKAFMAVLPSRPLSLASLSPLDWYVFTCWAGADLSVELDIQVRYIEMLGFIDTFSRVRGYTWVREVSIITKKTYQTVADYIQYMIRINLVMTTPVRKHSGAGRNPKVCYCLSPFGREVLGKLNAKINLYINEVIKLGSAMAVKDKYS